MKSKITGGPADHLFSAQIMGRYDVSFFQCRETGFIQTEPPYWLPEAYASPINLTDTGILFRNESFRPTVGSLLHALFPNESQFVDYAGGYGIFTRMMRDAGFDYYWDDPYAKNLCARGFEFDPKMVSASAITAFEVFEHLPDPLQEFAKMQSISSNVVFSTQLIPNPRPDVHEWRYFGLEHGQHVSFYTRTALEFLARGHGLNLVSNRDDLHLFLDPALLPHRIPARWFESWRAKQKRPIRQLLDKAFVFEPFPWPAGGLGQKFRNFLKRRNFPGLYVRRQDLDEDVAGALRSTSLTQKYAEHLLLFAASHWPYLSSRLNSRTIADHNLMRDRMLSE